MRLRLVFPPASVPTWLFFRSHAPLRVSPSKWRQPFVRSAEGEARRAPSGRGRETRGNPQRVCHGVLPRTVGRPCARGCGAPPARHWQVNVGAQTCCVPLWARAGSLPHVGVAEEVVGTYREGRFVSDRRLAVVTVSSWPDHGRPERRRIFCRVHWRGRTGFSGIAWTIRMSSATACFTCSAWARNSSEDEAVSSANEALP